MAIDERPPAPHRPSLDGLTAPQPTRFPTPAARVRRWQRLFATLLSITDTLVIMLAVFTAQFIRFGFVGESLVLPGIRNADVGVAYTIVSIVMIAGWALSLRLFGTRDYKIIGTGVVEYKRVTNATFAFFGLFAILAFALQAQIGRAYLLIALPLGWLLLMVSRWLWRKWLIGRRRRGRLLSHAVLVGDRASSLHVAQQIQRDPGCGLEIVGAITERGNTDHALSDRVPVLGDWNHLLEVVDKARADTVIITGNHTLKPRHLRELGWGLEERKANLIVAPALTDIAGPRIHSTPVAGLPLIHVDYPEFTGVRLALKRASDVVVSGLALVLLSPVFLVLSVVVRSTSTGPAFFRQERVGLHGKPFRMLKFRTMVADAEQQLSSLLDASEGNGVLFKMRNDPRITPVGRFLRRYSIDELPQLWNVFKGDMSLVGPRPPLASEVESYERWVHRRLLVKPGITGLWQVSGRSDLSWEDSIRLDLYYVENWSVTTDLVILWRTVKAVVATRGAY
ncbi:sugar transferase [Microbacterium gallinarum]|uniref:Sugar transferase n=1 Tax=Microbacterium gallinarum TaxID=2762209 RepID=A0ABR8X3H4_9MICO|nr:sugar transferase [Microbacterium gallinarum]MBD8023737.1 sugar transferase [Microbacterium gallinarum]